MAMLSMMLLQYLGDTLLVTNACVRASPGVDFAANQARLLELNVIVPNKAVDESGVA